ncbi:MAG TPA: lysophospholipid acyltransferase family protein [Dehalococcoidia bacterium]|nr:lysophospholipid acyltransferase family protein [Dehalococcoidia bacterium]
MAVEAKAREDKGDPWYYTANKALASIIPLGLGYWFSLPIADLFYGLWHSKRLSTKRNYAYILGRQPEDPEVAHLARSSFRHFGKYIVELLHIQGWSVDQIRKRTIIHGEEHFHEARSYGRGVIFTSAHMGSIEVASSLLLTGDYKITSVAEWLRPKLLMDWIVTCRKRAGVTLLPARGTGMKLIRALRRNEMVALVVDVGVRNGDGRPVTFCGHKTFFPTAPARLARITGAPVVFGIAIRKPGNKFEAYISPPIFANPDREPEEDAQTTTQRVLQEFEHFVRQYPDQWYAFRDMFPEDGALA